MLSVILGTAGAWLLHRHSYPGEARHQSWSPFPMVMPEILIGIKPARLLRQRGALGLGFTTVIIGHHVTFSFPFVLVGGARPGSRAVELPPLEKRRSTSGRPRSAAFRHVIHPCLQPAIIAGALMACHPVAG